MNPNLKDFLSQEDLVIFGFDAENNPYTNVMIYVGSAIALVVSLTISVLLVHMTLVLRNLKKSSIDSVNFKRRIVIMLYTRTLTPLLTGILPTALSVIMACTIPERSFIIASFLMLITFTVGFCMCTATIIVFKPFREALFELVQNPKRFFKKKSNS